MTENQHSSTSDKNGMSKKKALFISLSILLAAALATLVIFLTEPEAKRAGATKETAMLVDIVTAQSGTFSPTVKATGTVQAAQDIVLSPRVSGEIISRSEAFIPGSYVKKGKMLLQIDPSDYKNSLQLRQSELEQAMADYNIELGRQSVAKQDYEFIGDTLSAENQALVLRKPQLRASKSRVDAARASVAQAQLNLDRTTIKAPFDAQIITRNANVGTQVAPGEPLGRLVGIDEYWVVTTIPLSKVRWLTFSEDINKASKVKVHSRAAWSPDEYRTGYLTRLIGALEEQTRLARVLVTIPDPLSHKTKNKNLPQLLIGSFMEVEIEAREIEDVVRLNRDFIRKNKKVWVMEDSMLFIRDVNILFQDAVHAYIDSGLSEGEKIVTTNLSTVVDSARLRTGSQEAPGDPEGITEE